MQWTANEIAYCSNVHPGTRADLIEANIKNISAKVAQNSKLDHVDASSAMNLGLWLCEAALEEYQDVAAKERLHMILKQNNLFVSTLNGFPQGDFHQKIVKDNVYLPSWDNVSRLNYTKKLAVFLADILPEDCSDGTISTLPLAYRIDWSESKKEQSIKHLLDYVKFAKTLYEQKGKKIRLCIEMEPGCVLETTEQVVRFFTEDIASHAKAHCIDPDEINNFLGLCYDICHQAVMREDINKSLRSIADAGIVIGKVQVSSALKIQCSLQAFKALEDFAEPKYLHQVTVEKQSQGLAFYDDLSEMLIQENGESFNNARVHFHLPIQSTKVNGKNGVIQGFSSTQEEIKAFFKSVDKLAHKPQLEVETYTWQVLPEYDSKLNETQLVQGISSERRWLIDELSTLGLIAP